MTFFEMYEINPSSSRGQRVSERKGETTEPFNMAYLVLKKKIFSRYFFLFLSVENFAGKGCPISSIFIVNSCHLTHVRVTKVGATVLWCSFALLFYLLSPSVEICIGATIRSLAFSRNAIKQRRQAAETPARLQPMSKTHSLSPSVIIHVAFSPSGCYCFKNWF